MSISISHYDNLHGYHQNAASYARELRDALYAEQEEQAELRRAQRAYDEAVKQLAETEAATLYAVAQLHANVGTTAHALVRANNALEKRKTAIHAARVHLANMQSLIDAWYTEANPDDLKRNGKEEEKVWAHDPHCNTDHKAGPKPCPPPRRITSDCVGVIDIP